MIDMTLEQALAEVKRGPHCPGQDWESVRNVILKAVASGDLIPATDTRLAVAEALRRAADAASEAAVAALLYDDPNASPLKVQLHRQGARRAVSRLVPADALAEVLALRAERDEYRDAWEKDNADLAASLLKLEAAEAKLTEWQAAQHYSYIGRNGKPVLARDLEARAEAAEAQVAALQILHTHGADTIAAVLILEIANALRGRDRVVLTNDETSLGPRILEFAAALAAKGGE